jgi:hypothetical protein
MYLAAASSPLSRRKIVKDLPSLRMSICLPSRWLYPERLRADMKLLVGARLHAAEQRQDRRYGR